MHKMKKDGNIMKNIKFKNIDLIKKLGSLDYNNCNMYLGIYSSIECMILEIQNIEGSDVDTILKEYCEKLDNDDGKIICRLGYSYDEVKSCFYILYEYSRSGNLILLSKALEEKCLSYIETLEVIKDLIEQIKYFHNKYYIAVNWLFPWNVLYINKHMECPTSITHSKKAKHVNPNRTFIIEPFFGEIYHKLLLTKESEYVRRDIRTFPPEMFPFADRKYSLIFTQTSDVWNLGLLIFEMATNMRLYKFLNIRSENDLREKLKADINLEIKDPNVLNDNIHQEHITMLQDMRPMLENCLKINPKERLSLDKLSEHIQSLISFHNNYQIVNEVVLTANEGLNLYNTFYKNEISGKIDEKNKLVSKQKETIQRMKKDAEYTIKNNTKMYRELIDELEKNQLELMNRTASKIEKKINEYQMNIENKSIMVSMTMDKLKNEITEMLKTLKQVKNGEIDPKAKIKKSESLVSKSGNNINDLKEFVNEIEEKFSKWDKQFEGRLIYIKNVNENLMSHIMENISFVKFHSFLRCGGLNAEQDYEINQELIVNYLDSNFFFLKKYLHHFSNFLDQIEVSLASIDTDASTSPFSEFSSYLESNMERAKNEIFDRVVEEVESRFDSIVELNVNEIKILIAKEKVEITKGYSTTNLVIANLIANVEVEIETRIIESIKSYLESNKDFVLFKIALILTQDILIHVFGEKFISSLVSEYEQVTAENANVGIKLDLNYLNLGMEGWQVISEIIKKNNTLLENISINALGLKSNKLTDQGISDLSLILTSIKGFSSLHSLNLFNNSITSNGVAKLVDALKMNSHLFKLSLLSNNIGLQGVIILSQGLAFHNNIITLDIGNNNITDDGVKVLCENFLYKNSTLLTLSLYSNMITDEGVKVFYQTFTSNPNLKIKNISFAQNMITHKNLKLLLDIIADYVHTLDFNNNQLGDPGAEMICEFLKNNDRIVELGIARNTISSELILEILNIVANENLTIEKISIGNNNFTDDDIQKVLEGSARLLDVVSIEDEEEETMFQNQRGKNQNPDTNKNITIEKPNERNSFTDYYKKLSILNNFRQTMPNFNYTSNIQSEDMEQSRDNFLTQKPLHNPSNMNNDSRQMNNNNIK